MSRLVAAAGMVSAAAIVPATSASAATGKVGVVVRSSDSSVVAMCVPAGGTGLKILSDHFPTTVPTSGPYAGFVVQINRVGKNPPDDTHYWSYWHSSGTGTWTYSSSGAGSYTPKAGTVEGWSYVSGQQQAPKPPSRTFTSICGAAKSKPKPTVTSEPKPAPHSSTPASSHVVQPLTSRRTSHRAAQRTAKSARTTHPRASTAASSSASPSVSPSASTAVDAEPTTSPLAAQRSSGGSAGSGFPAWGTIVAVVVVLALGGTAWLRLRRRPG